MVFEFDGFIPYIHPSAFIHPQATVIGNVSIGKDVFIGAGAVIRGDWGEIEIEDGCNVQENCVLHMFPGTKILLKKNVHIGHGAIIHGGTIGQNSLIGMNAVVMDEANIGKECIVGALAFVKAKSSFEPRSLIVGNPAKKIKSISDEMMGWKTQGTALYQRLPQLCKDGLKECAPLREKPKFKKEQKQYFKTWVDSKNKV